MRRRLMARHEVTEGTAAGGVACVLPVDDQTFFSECAVRRAPLLARAAPAPRRSPTRTSGHPLSRSMLDFRTHAGYETSLCSLTALFLLRVCVLARAPRDMLTNNWIRVSAH